MTGRDGAVESENRAPKAGSLADALVEALARRSETSAAEDAAISAVTVGGAVVVGQPTDNPEAQPDRPATSIDAGASRSTASPPTAEARTSTEDEPTSPRGLPADRNVPPGIRIRYFGKTDVGLVREHNEDNFLVIDVDAGRRGVDANAPIETSVGSRGCILAVCDGMGGAAAGEVASQMAVDTIAEMMTAGGAPKDRDDFARRLVHAIEEAGSRIFTAAKLDRTRRGMGTTSTVAGLVDSTLFVGQVGDSRAYVLRNDQFALITKDQSLVNQLIEAGQLTEEEAEAFEHSNIILQALGTTEEVAVDLTFLELRRGDKLLLCSDGLSGLVHGDMIKDVLRASRDLVDIANQLVAMANAGGGHDNITVVIAEFDGLGLREPTPDAKVAYQQYPLPLPDDAATIHAPPARASTKTPAAKPGADVKSPASSPALEETGGGGSWWIVAVLVVLVLVLLGAILVTMEPPPAAEGPRTTLSSPARAPAERTQATTGHLRFDGRFAGAMLRIDGVDRGSLSAGSMILDVPAGEHEVEALRDGEVVARARVAVEAGHHAFVDLRPAPETEPTGLEPPTEPTGLEVPEAASEPRHEGAEALQPASSRPDVRTGDVESRRPRPGSMHQTGDSSHEPAGQ